MHVLVTVNLTSNLCRVRKMRRNRNVDGCPNHSKGREGATSGRGGSLRGGLRPAESGPGLFAWSPNGQFIATASQLRLLVHDRKETCMTRSRSRRAAPVSARRCSWRGQAEREAGAPSRPPNPVSGTRWWCTRFGNEAMRLENVQMAKELTHIAWTPGPRASVGTAKGNLLLRHQDRQDHEYHGQAHQGITCGA